MLSNQFALLQIFIISTLFSCTKLETFEVIELPFDGKVVYVEDLTGRNGLTANPFGDLVLLDGQNNLKQIITNDGFYYSHPNLTSDNNSIVFESKRDRSIITSGLSVTSKLYKLDMQNNEVYSYWDIIYEKTGFELGETMRQPSLSPSGQKIALYHIHFGGTNFMAVDFANNKILQITNDNKRIPSFTSNISWSPNEEYIMFEPSFSSRGPVLLFNFLTSELTSIVHPNYDSLEGEKRYTCNSGDWIDDSSFYFSCSTPPYQKSQIFKYSLHDNVSNEVMVIEDVRIKSLQTNKRGDQILFIGEKSDLRDDIYLLNVSSNEIVRITHDEKQKGWLRWYPSE